MARLACVADGNFTDAATWAVINDTSYVESESSTITVATTYSLSYVQFTPGAITVDGIGLKLNNRTGTTGTFSTELYNHTAGASVAGTEVTINCSDFVDALTASADGGWYFFKFSAPVLLIAANAYTVRVKSSSSSQIVLQAASTTSPSKFLRTTTTAAPAAGDDFFIMGEWTAAATTVTRTVTNNNTNATDYGSGSTSAATPALSVSAGGIMQAGTTAATAYTFKLSGNCVIYNGGILRIATSGARMPTDSSFTWTLDCGANVDFGIDVRRKGTRTFYGESKTRWTTLTADVAVAATVIPVVSTAGWKAGDVLVFSPTGVNATQGEVKTILTVDSATQVTLTAGLTNAHAGTGSVIGEVGNITSNVKIQGVSQSLCTFICDRESSLGVLDNVEVQYIGSGTANKRGVESQHINSSTNSSTIISSSFKDYFANASATVGNIATTGAFYYITNSLMVGNNAATGLSQLGGLSGTPTFEVSGNLITSYVSIMSGIGFNMGVATGASGICANNRIAGCATGISFTSGFVNETLCAASGFKIHSCTTAMIGTSTQNKLITSFELHRNSIGMTVITGVNVFESCSIIGNSSSGINNSSSVLGRSTYNNCVFAGDTGFAQPIGYSCNNTQGGGIATTFNSCTFGVGVAHSTSDLSISAVHPVTVILNNCTLASTLEFNATAYAFVTDEVYVGVQRKDTTATNHLTYVKQAIITPDTSIYRTASPSLRIAPKSASITSSTKIFPFRAYVNTGQTATPSIYVRESVVGDGTDYNGNFAKLYVKANYNLGITSDTLLDTATAASTGGWEQLTGTTAAVTDNGVLEFYIVVDGTTGWLNIDDFSYTRA